MKMGKDEYQLTVHNFLSAAVLVRQMELARMADVIAGPAIRKDCKDCIVEPAFYFNCAADPAYLARLVEAGMAFQASLNRIIEEYSAAEVAKC